MGVNEAGRPLIHTNHGYGHGVAEAPKHPPAKKQPANTKPKTGNAAVPNTRSTAPKQPVSKAAHATAPAKREQLKPAERREIDIALARLEAAETDAAKLELETAVGLTLHSLAGPHTNDASRDHAANRIYNTYVNDAPSARSNITYALEQNGIKLGALRR